jgi:hypothetical protein
MSVKQTPSPDHFGEGTIRHDKKLRMFKKEKTWVKDRETSPESVSANLSFFRKPTGLFPTGETISALLIVCATVGT